MWRTEGQYYKRFFPEKGVENSMRKVTFAKELYFLNITPFFILSTHFAPCPLHNSLKAHGVIESFGIC